MFTVSDFSKTPAQEQLLTLRGDFKYPATGNIDEVNTIIDNVIDVVNGYSEAPKYVINRSLYPEEDGVTLKSARFVVRPSSSHKLEINELKSTFVITADANFFNRLIEELAHYFDVYAYFSKLQHNLDRLNEVFAEVLAEEESELDIKFTAGRGLVYATDTEAVVGLTDEVIQNLGSLPLFDTVMEMRVDGYKQRIRDLVKEIGRAYEIVKIKSDVTKDLDIYTRRKTIKLIRSFVNRNAQHVRVGVGYIETEKEFAVIEKTAVTPEELAELDTTGLVVEDNINITKRETEEGKTKIITRYLITPFDKEDGEPLDVELKELVLA